MATILVVDDQRVIQRLLSAQLRKNGHVVETAGGAGEALERLHEFAFDVVILDIAMPEMDGLALLRLLRADPRYVTLPVIMLTASGQDGDRETAQTYGADAFLNKPTSSWELAETVNGVLSRSSHGS